MGTDSKVLDRTEEVAKKVAADNPRDFKSNVAVSAQIGSDKDPMKFYIQVYWCFTYNGELPCSCPAQSALLHSIDSSCCLRSKASSLLAPGQGLAPCFTLTFVVGVRVWQVS